MKIEIIQPEVPHPCLTPYGVIDKNFTAKAKLNRSDHFSLEYEVEVVTSYTRGNRPLGIYITRLTVIAEPSSRLGITTTQIREIQPKALLEATIHQAIYPGTRSDQLKKFSSSTQVTAKQKRAAEIIMDNPGKSHAQLLMNEFGITEGTARNLKTRVMKLGLIPNPYVEPIPVSIADMSATGDYIDQVLLGQLAPVSPYQRKAQQMSKSTTRKKGR